MVGFKVRPTPDAEKLLREKNMTFLQFDVVYALFDWVKSELEKLLENEKIITELGNFKTMAIFRTEKSSMILGGRVETGKIKRDCLARVKRNGEVLGTGKITKCQIGKQEMKEVTQGSECGITFEGKTRIEVGDVLEFYTEESKVRKIIFQ